MSSVIHLVAGHDKIKDPGTSGNHPNTGILTESELTIEMKEMISNHLNIKGIKHTKDNDKHNLRQVISVLNSTVKPEDVVIDIHFNGFHLDIATGTEVLTPRSPSLIELKWANKMVNTMARVLVVPNRGVKPETSSARGSLGIMRVPCHVILLEIVFLTNPRDVSQYQQWKHILASEIADDIRILLDLSKT